MVTRPATVITRSPNRCDRRGAITEITIRGTVIGTNYNAEASGPYHRISCRYCTKCRNTTKVTKNWMATDNEPALKPRLANNRTSNKGAEDRSSIRIKKAVANMPAPALARTIGSAQPRAGNSIVANTIPATATAAAAAPTQSTGG